MTAKQVITVFCKLIKQIQHLKVHKVVVCAGLVITVLQVHLPLFHAHQELIILQEGEHPFLQVVQLVMLARTARVMDLQLYKFVMKGGIVNRVKFHQHLTIVLITNLKSVQLDHIAHQEFNTLAQINIKIRLDRTHARRVQLVSNVI